MKILVVSDSHGDEASLSNVLCKEKDCKIVFHLGDGLMELER